MKNPTDLDTWEPTRVPVVLYVRTSHPDSTALFLAEARIYAEVRDWNVVAELSDRYGPAGTADRPGWTEARTLVERRCAAGIVTRYQSMIAPQHEFADVDDWLKERGAFLTCTWQASVLAAVS